jgi:hypothetical protein
MTAEPRAPVRPSPGRHRAGSFDPPAPIGLRPRPVPREGRQA